VEDGGRKFLRNVGKYIPDYTASYPIAIVTLHDLHVCLTVQKLIFNQDKGKAIPVAGHDEGT
jgi:hypothetical protein